MVSWSRLFNKFLFLKSAPPLGATDPFFHFHSMILSRFQSPFSFTIHLHSLIRVSRRDKKKHFKVRITREKSSARGTLDARQLHVSWFISPIHRWAPFWQAHRSATLLWASEAWHRPLWSAGPYSGTFCAKQRRELKARNLRSSLDLPLPGLYCFF